jgi:hypothetical protein
MSNLSTHIKPLRVQAPKPEVPERFGQVFWKNSLALIQYSIEIPAEPD